MLASIPHPLFPSARMLRGGRFIGKMVSAGACSLSQPEGSHLRASRLGKGWHLKAANTTPTFHPTVPTTTARGTNCKWRLADLEENKADLDANRLLSWYGFSTMATLFWISKISRSTSCVKLVQVGFTMLRIQQPLKQYSEFYNTCYKALTKAL